MRLRSHVVKPVLAIIGVGSLCYILGAAVMFFGFPTSEFLHSAFRGAQAWGEQQERAETPATAPVAAGVVDKPGKTYDGFTLYAMAKPSAMNTRAVLANMRGDIVHEWSIPFSRIWRTPPHLKARIDDTMVCFFGCRLYPNGDLLAVMHGLEDDLNGYGLVKLDKDSNIVWKYAANIHHDVDVGEDGTIYAVGHREIAHPPEGLEFITTPCVVDYLITLSPEGKELTKPLPVLETLRDSPYAPLLELLGEPDHQHVPIGAAVFTFEDQRVRNGDALHTNFVHVLTRDLAPRFPQFRAGQVLISMRHLDALAVLDLERRAAVWAARGPWRSQHDAQFLDNGRLLIFDNLGSPQGSRVLEYDPVTQALPWSYAGEDRPSFFSAERGMSQRLPNGNTLIVNSQKGEVFEVTPAKEVVWTTSTASFVTTARRFGPDELPFLKGGTRARP